MIEENKFFISDYTPAQNVSLGNTKAQILNTDQFDATIISTKAREENTLDNKYIGLGKNKDAQVQTLIKKNGANMNIYGVIGKTNDYWNLDWNNSLTQNRVTMYAQGFEGDDKVSLFREYSYYAVGTGTIGYKAVYTVQSSNNINMKIENSVNGVVTNSNWLSDHTTLSGVPVTGQKLADGQTQSIELVKSSNVRMR